MTGDSEELSIEEAEELWAETRDLFLEGEKDEETARRIIAGAERLIEQAPRQPVALGKFYSIAADAYSQILGQYDEAIEYYEQALEHNPSSSLAGTRLGELYMRHREDYAAAERVLQEVIERDMDGLFRMQAERLLEEARQKLGR